MTELWRHMLELSIELEKIDGTGNYRLDSLPASWEAQSPRMQPRSFIELQAYLEGESIAYAPAPRRKRLALPKPANLEESVSLTRQSGGSTGSHHRCRATLTVEASPVPQSHRVTGPLRPCHAARTVEPWLTLPNRGPTGLRLQSGAQARVAGPVTHLAAGRCSLHGIRKRNRTHRKPSRAGAVIF